MEQRPARILFYPVHFIAESWNGIDEHLRLLARHLDRGRFEPVVLAHETDGPQTELVSERAGIALIEAPYHAGAGALSRLRALRQLYTDQRFDLVHLHSPTAGGQAVPALAARLAGVPVLATYHQVQPWQASLKTRAVNRTVHSVLIETLTAVSQGVKSTLVTRTGLAEGRIQVLHNGIDLSGEPGVIANGTPARSPGEVRLAYFGRLSPEKGLTLLLRALQPLSRRVPNVTTWIAGEGAQRPELESLAERLGLAERVRFLGFRPDARALMEEVDIVVHVPEYEGFGLVALEAMAAARPVVVNDAPGGLGDIVVHGETGLVVPAGSAEALAEALARLANDPAERERLGRSGRARCEQEFSAERTAERTAALYERLLKRRGRDRRASPATVSR